MRPMWNAICLWDWNGANQKNRTPANQSGGGAGTTAKWSGVEKDGASANQNGTKSHGREGVNEIDNVSNVVSTTDPKATKSERVGPH